MSGAVDHNGSETAVDAGFAGLKIGTVIQVEHDGDLGAFDNRRFHQLHKISMIRICTRALADLKDDRSLLLFASLGDALNDLHIVNVKGADRVAAVISFFEHFFRSN